MINSLFLSAIVFCLTASAYDFFERRVPNWLNATFFLLAIIYSLDSLVTFSLFSLTVLCFAYLLYFFKVWGAGDAKFFVVLSAFTYCFQGVSLAPLLLVLFSTILVFFYGLLNKEFVRRISIASKKAFQTSVAPASFLWLLPIWLVLPGALFLWLIKLPWLMFPLFLGIGLFFGLVVEKLLLLFSLFFLTRFAFSLKGLKHGFVTFFAPFLSIGFALVVLL